LAVKKQKLKIEVCILAGGGSHRMRQDKSRLKLGDHTLLTHARVLAEKTGLPSRVIRKDDMPNCGPLGGVITALRSTNADSIIFLSCDMPFLSAKLVKDLNDHPGQAVFTQTTKGVGFPFRLNKNLLHLAEKQLSNGEYSLQALAKKLRAHRLRLSVAKARQLFNINTPADWAAAKKRVA